MFLLLAAALSSLATAAVASRRNAARPRDFEVSRRLLEERYPVFRSFDSRMYSGSLPADLLPDDDDGDGDDDDMSSYFFSRFLPKGGGDDDDDEFDVDAVESFHDDMLVVWLNSGPGVSVCVPDVEKSLFRFVHVIRKWLCIG